MSFSWVAKAFSDNGTPSSSRLLTAISMIVVLAGWLFVAVHNHQLPDGAATAGAAALGTAPYALNRATTAWGKDKDERKDGA